MDDIAVATYETRRYVIAAGALARIDANCEGLALLALTAGADLRIKLNHGQEGTAHGGWHFRGHAPDAIRFAELRNAGGSPATVDLAIFRGGDFADRRFTATGTLTVEPAPAALFQVQSVRANTFATAADLSVAAGATQQAYVNAQNRRQVLLQNLDGTITVRVGDSSVGASRGLRLGPGDMIILTVRASVHVHNPGGSTVAIGRAEIVEN